LGDPSPQSSPSLREGEDIGGGGKNIEKAKVKYKDKRETCPNCEQRGETLHLVLFLYLIEKEPGVKYT